MGERPGPDPQEMLAVGRITRAHGIRGEVSVLSLTEVETRYAPGSTLRLEDGRTLTVDASRPHGHRLLVKFREVPDRTVAEQLRGEVLLVASTDAPAAPEGAFWVHEVVGLRVVTDRGTLLGRIKDVLQNPANDLWVIEGADGELLLPALREVVREVDVRSGRVTVREVEGLTTEVER